MTGTASGSRRGGGIRRGEARAGWLFVTPAVAIVGVFLAIPILLALWVSFSDWNGFRSPLNPNVNFVGLDNYAAITTDTGLDQRNFGRAVRNNLWYVVFVVPLQTIVALLLAVQVNRAVLRGRGFFRTAFYFPSVTSTVAIVVVFQFLFTASGAVNAVLGFFGINGPNWFNDPSGVFHNILAAVGVTSAPAALAESGPLGVTWWEWLAGPSVAMSSLIILAIFTTSGTFMLLFLAGLQNIGAEVDEAARMDGAGPVRTFFSVTLPMLRPTLFTVLTLGLIGSWQVFDQIYVLGGSTAGGTIATPAFLAYQTSFDDLKWGQGAAIAFILFVFIILLTLFQRWVLRERDPKGMGRSGRRAGRGGAADPRRHEPDAASAAVGADPADRALLTGADAREDGDAGPRDGSRS
ncbi:carbohydrate ABC transporter permease [Agromyces sp. C10]|uniref:carbohydrate ABC transporter permease n=1 Tax=Agromyces sp. C10 TaxID=2935077 RepID=UPI00200A86CF|nr:sugar ABC transporter permease [Agromyces sp. C10]MCK8608086.1 sugar ABC transporter permease [Agromyces sp. C10]